MWISFKDIYNIYISILKHNGDCPSATVFIYLFIYESSVRFLNTTCTVLPYFDFSFLFQFGEKQEYSKRG